MEQKNSAKTPHTIPDVAFRGIATGLFMMAFFTCIWAGIAFGGLYKSRLWFLPVIFGLFVVLFVVHGFRIWANSKKYKTELTEQEKSEKKNVGKWFGIIFGAEGLGIFLGVNLAIYFGHPELVIPVIALVVGLHFYPLARIFKRSIDYYLATWCTLIAICAIGLSLNNKLSVNHASAFVGIGIALATTGYGFYMISEERRLNRMNSIL